MRALLTTTPDRGHLYPLVPLAWALRCAGHQVLVTGPEPIAPDVQQAGLEHASTAQDPPSPPDPDSPREQLAHHRAALAELAAATTVDLVGQWRPDIVISEHNEQAGPLAAALAGIPSATHQRGLHTADEPVTGEAMGRLHALHERFGLLPEETTSTTTIDLCPPSLRETTDDGNALGLRHIPYGGGGTPSPWLWSPHTHPRVCVSVGSTPNSDRDNCLRALAEELSDFDGEVVITGIEQDDAESPPLPVHVRTAAWLPHDQVFPTCDVVIHHGGSGVAMNALRFGLPQLVLPRTEDQLRNATRLVECGVARSVDVAERAEGLLRQEVEWLLTERAHRGHACQVRAEIESMPAPGQVATALEDLAASGRTRTRGPEVAGCTLAPAQ